MPLPLQEEVRLRRRTLQYTVTGTDGAPLVVYWVFLGMKKMLTELDPSPLTKLVESSHVVLMPENARTQNTEIYLVQYEFSMLIVLY